MDPNAFVSDNKVVAIIDVLDFRLDVPLPVPRDANVNLHLEQVLVVCTLAPTTVGNWGNTFASCTLGGRLSASSILKQTGQLPDPLTNNHPLCAGTAEYSALKTSICGQIDLQQNVAGTPTNACDALSLGMTFTTKPALIGDLFTLKSIVDPCPADPLKNPKYDCCESIGVVDAGAGRLAACGFVVDGGTPGSADGGR
jgi:hypothetical protein